MNTENPNMSILNQGDFNPHEHFIQIRSGQTSKDYLPVQWRLVWFRSMYPQGSIETEMVLLDLDRDTEEEAFVWNAETRRSEKVIKHAKGFCIFKATVKDGKGGIAVGTKSEKAASFPDFIEKAETGAEGRALAALGYGTQFVGDEFDEAHRIVDAPVTRSDDAPSDIRESRPRVQPQPQANDGEPITEQMTETITTLSDKLKQEVPAEVKDMTCGQARIYIKGLTDQLNAQLKARKAS